MDMTVLLLAAACAVALFVGWLVGRASAARECARISSNLAAEQATSAARLEEAVRRARELELAQASREEAIARLQRQVADLREEQGRLMAQLEGERQLAAEKLSLLRDAEAKLREAFASLSAEALRTNTQSFLELAKTSLADCQRVAAADLQAREQAVSDMLKPLRESLDRVGTTLQQVEKDRAGANAAIAEQIKSVAAGQQGLQTETAKLVNALREPKARGRWGEIQLRRVVELAGMLDHCDFYEQQSMTAEDDSRLIPDLVVRLPGGRQVIVDAKVPLTAYLAAFEAGDEETREAYLKDHARQVREHMKKLAAKGYADQIQPAPEFVVMFLPGEPFFSAALVHDPTLIEWGAGQRVILASPITLIALLRAVAYGWRQEQIAENAQQISDAGREMFDRICVVSEHFGRLSAALNRTVEAHNQAVASLETRFLPTARRLNELGAGGGKEIPVLEAIDRVARAPRMVELPAPATDGEVETA
jgi:DNA recombination protein RmuC